MKFETKKTIEGSVNLQKIADDFAKRMKRTVWIWKCF